MAKGDKFRIVYQSNDGREQVLEVVAEKNGATVEANVMKEGKEDWLVVNHISKAGKELSVSKVKLTAVLAVVDLPAKPRE